jgi:tetraacyldisaccharide 4'-kinase
MTPFELLYFFGLSLKKQYALRNQKRLPRKVVSIGNVTLGGTGKTPASIALAGEAKQRGYKPCILTRGYKGRVEGPCFISRGEGPLLDADQAGDEAVLMAEKLHGVPIVKGKNRYEAGMFALSSLPSALSPNLFILDDGFQHWGLFRDKDILLIDSMNPFGNKRLFPLGSLREPVKEIKRADILVITNTPTPPSPSRGEGKGWGVKSLVQEIKQYNTSAPIFSAEHKPFQFIASKGEPFPLEWARDKKFFAFCGIGNPGSFKKTLLSLNIELKGLITFRDHHRYRKGDIRMVTDNAKSSGTGWIVTTEKDIMRLKGIEMPENMVSLAVEFYVGEEFYDEVFNQSECF